MDDWCDMMDEHIMLQVYLPILQSAQIKQVHNIANIDKDYCHRGSFVL